MERPVSPGVIASLVIACLPERLRVRAARRAVARLKHAGSPRVTARGPDPVSLSLLAGALLSSAALGYVVGTERGPAQPIGPSVDAANDLAVSGDRAGVPGIGAALAAEMPGEADGHSRERDPAAHGATTGHATRSDRAVDDGALDDGWRASDPVWSELGRVRGEILRLRVLFARLADVARLDDGEFDLDTEPLDAPAVEDGASAGDVLEHLSREALEPLAGQSARMARIFDERRAAHDRRVGGRVANGIVRTSGFGYRPSPTSGRRQMHRGLDFAGPAGTPLHALADGVVTWSGENGGYGNLVEIEHGDGYRTRYAHNQSNLVALGDRVRKGEAVATLGSSGRSTGPHVHVEVRRHGAPLDPALYVR